MRFLTAGSVLSVCFVCLWAAKGPDWKIGKVLDSKTSRQYLETSASTTASTDGEETTARTQVHHVIVQETELMIAGKDYTYVIHDPVQKAAGIPTQGILNRAIANRGHGCRFVVGDELKYYQEKAKLHVLDADGKECKLDILRQERIQR